MSIGVFVLSDSELRSIADWQNAIRAEEFPLHLSTDVQFEAVHGFLPVHLADKRTGFECYHDDSLALMSVYDSIDFGRGWTKALGFRFSGDFNELLAGWMAATAYARATDGVVFDPQESKVLTPQQALDVTRRIEQDLPAYERVMRDLITKLGPGSNG
jgi:hypothetical protein